MATKENTAIKPYMNAHAATLDLVSQLSELLEDCEVPSGKDDGNINWGHVGSMNEVHRQLTNAVEFLKEFN